jgi:hypothetical protein
VGHEIGILPHIGEQAGDATQRSFELLLTNVDWRWRMIRAL